MTIHNFDDGITLKTSYDCPSIGYRHMDWSCVNPDWYDEAPDAGYQIIGHGINEQAAIEDWFANYDEWYEYNGRYEISEK